VSGNTQRIGLRRHEQREESEEMEVNGAVVLVTGASSGIGRATALAFDRAGARVALAARRRERLEELASSMSNALVVPTDLADEKQAAAMVDATVSHFGRLDVLVNNAGAGFTATSDTLEPAAVRRLVETNWIGPMVATQRAVVQMRLQGGGHVINVGSPAGFIGVPLLAAYCGSKAAMSGWTRTLQAEWDGTEITVTEYLPGLIATELGEASAQASGLELPVSDTFQDKEQSFVTRLFSPLDPMRVGEQIVGCVRRPRAVMYSTLGTHVLCWFMQFAGLRRGLAAGMGRSSRKGFGLPVFGQPLPAEDEAQSGSGPS
jgi:NAD(P)-dependent dehydrogenase (short-subunit alcohol dehydrogenase family)